MPARAQRVMSGDSGEAFVDEAHRQWRDPNREVRRELPGGCGGRAVTAGQGPGKTHQDLHCSFGRGERGERIQVAPASPDDG
jgi:hypothetical protein